MPSKKLFHVLSATTLVSATLVAGASSIACRSRKGPAASTSKYTVSNQPLYTATENKKKVTVFYPSVRGLELVPRPREIYATSSVTNQMKQVVVELIRGPQPDESSAVIRALPESTRLREIYLSGPTAYVDLTQELVQNLEGGSQSELLTVYSVVDSLTYNFSDVRSVKILVEGAEVESLSGHIDLSRPLLKDLSYVREPES